MSSIIPGQGGGIVPVVLAATTVTVLPRTGVNGVVEIALAVAAGLAIWAIAYYATSKLSRR